MTDLRQPSFRGVPFDVQGDAPRDLGRRVFVHGFPYRGSQPEDMGPADQYQSLPAVILGPDYLAKRDAFEAALNAEGPGILIHPWIGQVRARLISAKVTESTQDGGMALYDLEFLPEPETRLQTSAIDTTAVALGRATALQAAAHTDFVQDFTVAGKPQFVLDEAAKTVRKLADRFDATVAPLRAAGDALSLYVDAGLRLRSQVIDLVSQPASLASQVSDLVQGIRTLAATQADALDILGSLFGFGDELKPVSRSTPSRAAQANNQTHLVAFVHQVAAAEVVRTVAGMDFAAYQDAVATRDTVTEQLDQVATAAADAGRDAVWRALEDALAAVVQDVTRRGGSLARLYSFTPVVAEPVLCLAYRLYDDSEELEARCAEIVARNRIVHPGFVPGGAALELLSDG